MNRVSTNLTAWVNYNLIWHRPKPSESIKKAAETAAFLMSYSTVLYGILLRRRFMSRSVFAFAARLMISSCASFDIRVNLTSASVSCANAMTSPSGSLSAVLFSISCLTALGQLLLSDTVNQKSRKLPFLSVMRSALKPAIPRRL